MTLENLPTNVPVADQPFIHLISAEAVVSAKTLACRAKDPQTLHLVRKFA